jgi:hypothetical protein
MTSAPLYDVVVPSIGRRSLDDLIGSLVVAGVDMERVEVVLDRSRRGPAAARNAGAHRGEAPWIVFLDDDVRVTPQWASALEDDLRRCSADVAAVQGVIRVPLPDGRRPTDFERNTARLEAAEWITADLAVRRAAFEEVGGFDPAFRRAYREDTDFALRLQACGWRLRRGRRETLHPARRSGFFASVAAQRGNEDDALLVALHGRTVLARLDEPRSRLPHYAVITGCLAVAVVAALARRQALARVAGAAFAGLSAALAWDRIRPGPRTAGELARMVVTTVCIPPAALAYRARGRLRWGPPGSRPAGFRRPMIEEAAA